jgi:hypothetical protein
LRKEEEGTYHVQFRGTFELCLDGNVTFYERMLIIFLGLLEMPEETRGSRRFWHWLEQDWGRMLSQRCGVVLLEEVRQRVIDSWLLFPGWSVRRAYELLRFHGQASRCPR